MQQESMLHEVCSEILVGLSGSNCPFWELVPIRGSKWPVLSSVIRLTFQSWLTYSLKMDSFYPSENLITTRQTNSVYAVCQNPANPQQAACSATLTTYRKEKLIQCLKRVMPATLLSASIWFPECISRLSESRVGISDGHNLLRWNKLAEGFIFYNKWVPAKETVGRDKTCSLLHIGRDTWQHEWFGFCSKDISSTHVLPP